MFRISAMALFLVSGAAFAQTFHHEACGSAGCPAIPEQMKHDQMMRPIADHGAVATPAQPGQGAFAAIQEIVGILESDPNTDWRKVDIDALRQHLVDMNNVTLEANVKNEPIDGGMRFVVTGAGAVSDSVRRMVTAHAAAMNGVNGWRLEAAPIEDGAILTVRPPSQDVDKLRGLGFFGILALGMHHQAHHLMIARGAHPHG
ncbi:MAG TPA: hypothetical protein VMI72_14455 [Roseiarcus sp.]|nr:hypothetical protein [Roseiarcus sp.]